MFSKLTRRSVTETLVLASSLTCPDASACRTASRDTTRRCRRPSSSGCPSWRSAADRRGSCRRSPSSYSRGHPPSGGGTVRRAGGRRRRRLRSSTARPALSVVVRRRGRLGRGLTLRWPPDDRRRRLHARKLSAATTVTTRLARSAGLHHGRVLSATRGAGSAEAYVRPRIDVCRDRAARRSRRSRRRGGFASAPPERPRHPVPAAH